MLVFNLTNQPLVYRKRTIPPEGSYDFKDMKFVPGRDKALEQAKVLSFGARPKGWKSVKATPMAAPKPAPKTVPKAVPVPAPVPKVIKVEAYPAELQEEVKVEEKVEFGVKKKRY